MSFQYTYDAKGKPVGVFVPINEWEKLTTELKKTKKGILKSRVLNSVEKGMLQVKEIEKGKLKSISLKQLRSVKRLTISDWLLLHMGMGKAAAQGLLPVLKSLLQLSILFLSTINRYRVIYQIRN